MSFNYHQDHFGSRPGGSATQAMATTAHTACVGFGLERLHARACSNTHGLDVQTSGRSAVREKLWG